jgi:AAA15 family ATPase/GTPase
MPKLRIENFKCYRKEELLFGDLTVLVGTNGAGKSSVIQSLLLLHEAVKSPKENRRLPLNDFRSQNLGSASDIVFNNDTSLDIKPVGGINYLIRCFKISCTYS